MNKNKKKLKRQIRTRSKVRGTKLRPRLTVFRSNRFIYAQIINDEKGATLVGVSEKELEVKGNPPAGGGKKERARKVGELLAKKAIAKKINKVVFDRGGYAYRGRVESVAQGARVGGLKF